MSMLSISTRIARLHVARNRAWIANVANATRYFSSYPPHEIVNMPALSPTMETGTIGKWLCGVGDEITPGFAIAEIETDKASMAFEAQDDFFIAKILVENGQEVPVGSPIFISVEDKDNVSAFESYTLPASSAVTPVAAAPETPVVAKAPEPPKKIEAPAAPVVSTPAAPNQAPAVPVPVVAPVAAARKPPTPAAPPTNVNTKQWGQGVSGSVLSKMLASKQSSYISKYGKSTHSA